MNAGLSCINRIVYEKLLRRLEGRDQDLPLLDDCENVQEFDDCRYLIQSVAPLNTATTEAGGAPAKERLRLSFALPELPEQFKSQLLNNATGLETIRLMYAGVAVVAQDTEAGYQVGVSHAPG